MKNIYRILLVLILPMGLFAQDTIVLKRQANVTAQAAVNGDYKTLIDCMYPKMVEMSGGKEKMIGLANSGIGKLKAQGIIFEKASIGSPGRFYKAGTEIHCIVPEILVIKIPGGHLLVQSNLLAISGDGGKNWKFLDLNKDTINMIHTVFPDFNPDLKIPDPVAPVRTE